MAGVGECERLLSAWRFGTPLPTAQSVNMGWASACLVPASG